MSIFSPAEQDFANSLRKLTGSGIDFDLMKVNLTGQFKTEAWFISGDSTGHPLRDHLSSQSNVLLKAIPTLGFATVQRDNDDNRVLIGEGAFELLGEHAVATDLMVGTLLDEVTLPTKPLVELSDGREYSSVTDETGDGIAISSDDSGIAMSLDPMTSSAGVKFASFWEGDAEIRGKRKYGYRGRVYQEGIYRSMDPGTLSNLPLLNVDEVYWKAGIHVKTVVDVDARNTASLHRFRVDLPLISGFRRKVLIVQGNDGLVTMSYYMEGEGKDIVRAYFAGGPDIYLYSVDSETMVEPTGTLSPRDFKWTSSERWYPVTFNTEVISYLAGLLIGEVETEADAQDPEASNSVMTVNVSDYYLKLDKAYYNDYLTTGFGINEPLSEERRLVVMASWANIPSSVSLMTTDWSGKASLKDTVMFKEYKKTREKACKENDFFSLPFNSEFTMKEVENKIGALTSVKTIGLDTAVVNQLAKYPEVSSDIPTYTLAVKDDVSVPKVLSFSLGGVEKGTFPGTESGVQQLLDATAPAFYDGDTAALESLLGAEGRVDKLPTRDQLTGDVSLRIGAVRTPGYSVMPNYLTDMTANERAIFLAHQVTDYREVVLKGPRVLQELTGRSIRNLIEQSVPVPDVE